MKYGLLALTNYLTFFFIVKLFAGFEAISLQTVAKVCIVKVTKSSMLQSTLSGCSVFNVKLLFVSFSIEGLHAIVVTDRDGVPVIKGKKHSDWLVVAGLTAVMWKTVKSTRAKVTEEKFGSRIKVCLNRA